MDVHLWFLVYMRTDSHLKTKIFQIDGLPNFLRYGAQPMRQRRTGALLSLVKREVILHPPTKAKCIGQMSFEKSRKTN